MGAKHSSKGINPQHSSMRLLQLSLFCRREYRGRETVVDIVMHSSNPLQEWKAYFQLLEVLPEDCLLMSALFGDCQCLRKLPCLRSCCIQWLIIMGPQRPDPLVSLGTTLKSSRAPCGGQLRPSLELHHSPTSPSAHPCVFPFSQVLISRALPLSQVWYQGISLVRILYANLCFRVCFLGNLTSNKDKVIYCTSQLVSGRGDIWT